MKLLFISRAFPPIVGGLEKHNESIYFELKKTTQVDSILNFYGKKALTWFIPWCIIKALLTCHRYDAILLGDGLLSIAAWPIKFFRPQIAIICIIHGLDITYPKEWYQKLWPKVFLRKTDLVIAVSHATQKEVTLRGYPFEKTTVIANGINKQAPLAINNLHSCPFPNPNKKIVLLTIARLVKRKGVLWFVSQVMPNLKDEFIYVIGGTGPELKLIQENIRKHGLEQNIFCLGFVSDEQKAHLFACANLFIQPNIKVPGDMEGFGIAVLEANAYGLPVLGAAIEGLKDSISEKKNGWLVESENASLFIAKIKEITYSTQKLHQHGLEAQSFILEKYSWDKIACQYIIKIKESIFQKHRYKRP